MTATTVGGVRRSHRVGAVCDGAMHSGEGTYYGADGSGNCSFDAAPGDPLVAAMNDARLRGLRRRAARV
jgi:hypothetical protein